MVLKLLFSFVFLVWSYSLLIAQTSTDSATDNQFGYSVLVNDISKDHLKIEYHFEGDKSDSLLFIIPSVIPGTYAFNNAEYYLKDFVCLDSAGNDLKTIKQGTNEWLIPQSGRLQKIRYRIKPPKIIESFDGVCKIYITDSCMLFNGFWVLGYFNRYRNCPFQLEITVAKELKPYYQTNSTHEGDQFKFQFSDYDELARNPILFAPIDTASVTVNNYNFNFSIYSENKNIKAAQIARWFKPMAGQLIKNAPQLISPRPYRFMMVFTDDVDYGGALEQLNASTYLVQASWDTALLKQTIRHLMSHEYMHKLTPLTFNSDLHENQKFRNFSSQHLWLYEGVVEYMSAKTMLQSGVFDETAFFQYLAKIYSVHKSLGECGQQSLIDLSKNVIKPENEFCYTDFYYRGALLAFILDVRILQSSGYQYGLLSAIHKYLDENGRLFDEKKFIRTFCSINGTPDVYYINDNFEMEFAKAINMVGYYFGNDNLREADFGYFSIPIQELITDEGKCDAIFKHNSPIPEGYVKLLTIDGQEATKDLAIKKLIFPPSETPIQIKYKSGDKIKEATLTPRFKGWVMKFNPLMPVKNQDKTMKTLRKALLKN